MGQMIEVESLGQDGRGHIRLSRKAVLPPPAHSEALLQQQPPPYSVSSLRPRVMTQAASGVRHGSQQNDRLPVDRSSDEDEIEDESLGAMRVGQSVRQQRQKPSIPTNK